MAQHRWADRQTDYTKIWWMDSQVDIGSYHLTFSPWVVGWLVVLMINVNLAIFQPYLNLEAGDNQWLKIQVARSGMEPRSSCSASQELNHSATAAPFPRGDIMIKQHGPNGWADRQTDRRKWVDGQLGHLTCSPWTYNDKAN